VLKERKKPFKDEKKSNMNQSMVN
jgi:hypothetical protein